MLLWVLICIAGAALNIAVRTLVADNIGFGFFDTIFTIAVTFSGGVFWGMLCGVLSHVISGFYFHDWNGYFFTICSIAVALITWLFIRLFPRELSLYPSGTSKSETPMVALEFKSRRFSTVIDRVIVLLLLSFGLCIVMSILGGLIAALIQIFNPDNPGNDYVSIRINSSMFKESLPLVMTEILARIPVNSIDRLISVFAGFGVAVLVSKLKVIK